MITKIFFNATRLILVLSIVLVTSCEKFIPSATSPQNYPGDNYSDIFEGFWNGMNNNYVFWSVDQTNWDNMYTKYKPLFANLKTFSVSNDKLAEQYFTEMTAKLIDSHFTINFDNTGNQVDASLNRKLKIASTYPDSIYELPPDFFTDLIPNNYIDQGTLKTGTDSILVDGATDALTVTTGIINNNTLYLYLSNFFFTQAGQNVVPVLNSFYSSLSTLKPNIKGIIIDLRGNGGGEVADLDFLLGGMIKSPLTFGYTRSKNGPGRLDYAPWAPAIVTPQSGAVNITIPIVVLADHLSASMAELTALAVKTLPNGKFIGTTTWGANGPLTASVYFNGGQFSVGTAGTGNVEYMHVNTSSVIFKYIDGTVYEGKGVPPDLWVPETASEYFSGRDMQIETAMGYISRQ